MVIGIIGAGAAGMAAALAAAENENVQVVLFERQARVGRKLQATGNGRCNLSNIHATVDHYHGEDAGFVDSALEKFGVDNTLSWFWNLGLFTVTEDSGKVYPYSDQANSVVDVLRLALEKPNICLHTGFEVQKVRKLENGFQVESPEEKVFCDKLIVACGGLAGTKLGGCMFGYKLLGKLGHRSTRLRPSLVQIKCDWHGSAALKGVRANCSVKICRDGKCFAHSTGEIQFTEIGLSGPVMFEISRDVCDGSGRWTAVLDLLPHCQEDALFAALSQRRATNLLADDLLTGIIHNRLGRVLCKSVGIKGTAPVCELNDSQLRDVCTAVKNLEILLTEPMGMDSAQVTAGGVLTRDFEPETMESRFVPGLYACGEVLDIDGDCGGYNLQWAWSSGRLAGLSAGKEAL